MAEPHQHLLSHLGFRRVAPSVRLTEFVDCYWFVNARAETETAYREFLHPDGGMGIIFNYGNALSFNKKTNKENAFLDGTNTRTKLLGLGGEINAVGIRFKPAGAYAFFNSPLNELKNITVKLSEIKSNLASSLFDEIHAQNGYKDKVRVIENSLLDALLSDRKISPVIIDSIGTVRLHKGMMPVKTLADRHGVGQRKLERLFSSQIGMSPNEFTKIVRAEHARAALKRENPSYSDIALNLGYFDQAHFTRSFNSVVGITPGEYRRRSLRNNYR